MPFYQCISLAGSLSILDRGDRPRPFDSMILRRPLEKALAGTIAPRQRSKGQARGHRHGGPPDRSTRRPVCNRRGTRQSETEIALGSERVP
jgi:hypothetical protein